MISTIIDEPITGPLATLDSDWDDNKEDISSWFDEHIQLSKAGTVLPTVVRRLRPIYGER